MIQLGPSRLLDLFCADTSLFGIYRSMTDKRVPHASFCAKMRGAIAYLPTESPPQGGRFDQMAGILGWMDSKRQGAAAVRIASPRAARSCLPEPDFQSPW